MENQNSKQSLVRWRRFHGYHCPDGNTHIKNGGWLKKYLKFTPTIHINLNSYSFRIMFIMIFVRFFIICFIDGWKYEKVAINWDRVTNWCVYLRVVIFGRNISGGNPNVPDKSYKKGSMALRIEIWIIVSQKMIFLQFFYSIINSFLFSIICFPWTMTQCSVLALVFF